MNQVRRILFYTLSSVLFFCVTLFSAQAANYTQSSAEATFNGTSTNNYFGFDASVSGDVNGDGINDLLVGAKNALSDKGAAYLFYGSKTAYSGSVAAADADAIFTQTNGSSVGNRVGILEDINGDGVDEIAVADPVASDTGTDRGTVYIFYGESSGDIDDDGNADSDSTIDLNDADRIIYGQTDSDALADYIVSVGDVNNDTYGDYILAARSSDVNGGSSGTAYLFYGASDDDTAQNLVNVEDAPAIFYGTSANDSFPSGVSGGQDMNGDTIDDFVLGNYEDDVDASRTGAVYLYFGQDGTNPFSGSGVARSEADHAIDGPSSNDFFGSDVELVEDLSGDTKADLVVGAAFALSNGAVYVFNGRTTWTAVDNTGNADASITGSCSCGMGEKMDDIGDYNGDGFGDVAFSETAGGGSNKGNTYVFFGGVGAISGSLAYTAADDTITGASNSDFLPRVIAGGADLDNDSADDLILTRFDASSNTGALYLFYGTDLTTKTPTLTSPAASSVDNAVQLTYVLPETPLAGSVTVTLNDGTTSTTLTMDNSTSVSTTLNLSSLISTTNVASASASTLSEGTYTATLAYIDAAGNPAALTSATSVILDTTAPVITLVGDAAMTLTVGDTYTESGVTVSDAVSTNLTSSVLTTGSVDTTVAGVYTRTYNVSDAAGNAAQAVTRTVTVVAAEEDVVDDDDSEDEIDEDETSDDTEETLGAVTALTSLKNNTVEVSYALGETKTFTLFANGAGKAKAVLHTNGDVIIAISKQLIRTFDAYTGEQIDHARLFSKKQYATKMKRYHVYKQREQNTVLTVGQPKKKEKQAFVLRATQVKPGGTIVRRNLIEMTFDSPVQAFKNLSIEKNNASGKKARFYFTLKGEKIDQYRFGTNQNGKILAK